MTFRMCVFETLCALFWHLCSYNTIKLRGDRLQQIPNLIPFEIESLYFFQEKRTSRVILLLKVALIITNKMRHHFI